MKTKLERPKNLMISQWFKKLSSAMLSNAQEAIISSNYLKTAHNSLKARSDGAVSFSANSSQ